MQLLKKDDDSDDECGSGIEFQPVDFVIEQEKIILKKKNAGAKNRKGSSVL